jgi:hypothetical protein
MKNAQNCDSYTQIWRKEYVADNLSFVEMNAEEVRNLRSERPISDQHRLGGFVCCEETRQHSYRLPVAARGLTHPRTGVWPLAVEWLIQQQGFCVPPRLVLPCSSSTV